ncbi:potassium channel subfamily K member 16-like [Eptesicus fuscus]|uniref:potassium channel subfamily K member 16-like n=1 Tax=Eptesicus fuscus TaxID=29078 RepID=UPI00101AAC1F|nr:potassium channel subfamily K member 16-like [Eptesicus fuscus]
MRRKEKSFSLTASRCILLMGFVGYYLMGAKIFQALEMDTQEDLKNTFWDARQALLNNYVNITPEELEIFLQKLSFAVKYGIIPVVNGTIYISWELQNSFTFVASTLSTIGYGIIAPRTPMGQIFCVFYGLLGIPLTIIFLKFLGKAISQPFSGLGTYLRNMGLTERQIKICIFIFFSVTGLIIFILVPPVVFKYTEGWPYNEGLYFAFVSLSTIGFGDYIPGVSAVRTYSPMYTVFMVPWYVFGLAWIALLFNLFSKLLERTKTNLNCKRLCQNEKISSIKASFFFWLTKVPRTSSRNGETR